MHRGCVSKIRVVGFGSFGLQGDEARGTVAEASCQEILRTWLQTIDHFQLAEFMIPLKPIKIL